jgi:hypothetical protein
MLLISHTTVRYVGRPPTPSLAAKMRDVSQVEPGRGEKILFWARNPGGSSPKCPQPPLGVKSSDKDERIDKQTDGKFSRPIFDSGKEAEPQAMRLITHPPTPSPAVYVLDGFPVEPGRGG